jgi:2-polyprenyl-3-methyl-5-hydroxy-6-metoxy-1,4-benzoquinol methylase
MQPTNPLRAEKFLRALQAMLEPARGTYICEAVIRDSHEKTNLADSSGYVGWLRRLMTYLSKQPGVSGARTLDVGCGTGELTVLMRLLGFDAVGIDVHERHIGLARMLAEENGLSPEMFICHEGNRLPFADKSFDMITMISVLEHLDDVTLSKLVPELARICAGILFVQAPNSASFRDDHTGLLFVPAMPNRLARSYVAVRGRRYRYNISASGSWDVNYRSFDQAVRSFQPHFDYNLSPDGCCYPQTPSEYSPTWIGKRFHAFDREMFFGLPLPWRQFRISRGYPKQAYYPYLNLTFRPKSSCGEN